MWLIKIVFLFMNYLTQRCY